MRVLMDVRLPVEKFNAAVQDGTVGQKINRILEETRPEAIYFTERNGQRTACAIVQVESASQIPALAEPWFLTFNAGVELHIAMTPADLKDSGLEKLGKKYA